MSDFDFSDCEIEIDKSYEFELTDTISIIYDDEYKVYYAQNYDEELENDIIIIADVDFKFEENLDIFGYILTKDKFEEIVNLVKNNQY